VYLYTCTPVHLPAVYVVKTHTTQFSLSAEYSTFSPRHSTQLPKDKSTSPTSNWTLRWLSGFWSQRRAIRIRAALNFGPFPSPVVIFRPHRMHSVLEVIDGHCWVAHEVLCSLTWNVVRGSHWPIFLLYSSDAEWRIYNWNQSWIL